MSYCPLGLECLFDESAPFYRKDCCVNTDTCYTWTTAWELPYWRDCDSLIVSFFGNYNHLQSNLSENPITSEYNWEKYFAEYGFAEPVALPYFFRSSDGTMMVFISEENVCRQEMQKAGYANATSLPLVNRKEYYSPDAYDGFNYLEVDLFFCGDEAINALTAGYANAVELAPLSLNEQRWEYDNSL